MKIKHYSYNAFTIEDGKTKIAIDPGQSLKAFHKCSLIPESEWSDITHIFVTHGDPDHFAFAGRMALVSGARVVCGRQLLDDFYRLGLETAHGLSVGGRVELKDLSVSGIKVNHGPLPVRMMGGLISVTGLVDEGDFGGQEIYLAGMRLQRIRKPMHVFSHGTVRLFFGLIRLEKDNPDFARGSIGLHVQLNGTSILNLGDSLIRGEWRGLEPDILMIPIGGGKVHNTMNIMEAIRAVKIIDPKLVIPCHYNVPFGMKNNINPTDDLFFRDEVVKMGKECRIMSYGDQLDI